MALNDYDPVIEDAAKSWNLDPNLLRSVILQESAGNPTATSSKGAYGLTGLMPQTAATIGVTNLKDPVQQIYGGARYLSEALDAERGSVPQALLYYHGGPAWRQQYGPESAGYVPGVAAQYARVAKSNGTPQTTQSDVPSDDDFLNHVAPKTSGTSPTSDVPSDDDFLKSVGAAPRAPAPVQGELPTQTIHPSAPTTEGPTPPSAPPQATPQAPLVPNDIDQNGQPITPSVPPPSSNPLASSIIQGAKEGFGQGPLGLSEPVQNALRSAGIYPPAGQSGTPMQAINQGFINPLAAAGDLALRSGGALFRGAQAGVSQLGNLLPEGPTISGHGNTPVGRYIDESLTSLASPKLALNDVAALPEAFPTGVNPSGAGGTVNPQVVAPAAVNPLQSWSGPPGVARGYLSPEFRANPGVTEPQALPNIGPSSLNNPLIDETRGGTPLTAPPPAVSTMGAPATGWGAGTSSWAAPDTTAQPSRVTPGQVQARDGVGYNEAVKRAAAENAANAQPKSAGAAGTPSNIANISPKMEQAYRSVAEGQKLNEPQPAGVPDYNAYVPGVEPSLAHLEQSANVSREQKMLESQIPEEFKAQASANNEARQQFFNGLAGSDVDVQNAVAARGAQAEKDINQAFSQRKPVDATPVVKTISEILNDPQGKENSQLQTYLKPLLNRLENTDGTLKNDPLQLYGLRQDIYRMTQKANAKLPTEEGNNLKFITGQLSQVMDSLDQTIEKGAPGYQQYLTNFAEASRPIDSMQALQGFENKLYDPQGRMQLSRVQNMMKNIVDARAAPGLNPYKSIPDETMAQLWNLRDDLRRVASADELARAKGSDTAQNAMDIMKDLAKEGAGKIAQGAAHLGAATVSPGYGNVAVHWGNSLLNNMLSSRAQKKLQSRASEMARPNKPLNPLQSP